LLLAVTFETHSKAKKFSISVTMCSLDQIKTRNYGRSWKTRAVANGKVMF